MADEPKGFAKKPTERQRKLCFYCGLQMRNNQWATVNEVALGRHAHWKCLVRVAYPDGDDPLARIGEVS